jgi:hypothetical protein
MILRVRAADGGWTYARSVSTSKGRIKPLYTMINGQPVHRPEGVYHLRYTQNGKRIWEPIGSDASLAQAALQRKTLEVQAGELGVKIPEAVIPGTVAAPVPTPIEPAT